MEKTGPTVGQQRAGRVRSPPRRSLLSVVGSEEVDFSPFVCFQQREPFKKRWFTLCAVSRKLTYYKTPLVNQAHKKHERVDFAV